jgi:large subunit ribosomal protein L6
MSRIGKQPVQIPEGVKAEVADKFVTATGPKGSLKTRILPGFEVKSEDNQLIVIQKTASPMTQKQFGLLRTLLFNMVIGVSEGFKKELEVNGVGFRVQMKGTTLVMNLGFSHPIEFTPEEGIEISVNQNIITVTGFDKQLVGKTAAQIRDFKKPEPYKGKGIRYIDEYVRRKAGKAAAAKGAA